MSAGMCLWNNVSWLLGRDRAAFGVFHGTAGYSVYHSITTQLFLVSSTIWSRLHFTHSLYRTQSVFSNTLTQSCVGLCALTLNVVFASKIQLYPICNEQKNPALQRPRCVCLPQLKQYHSVYCWVALWIQTGFVGILPWHHGMYSFSAWSHKWLESKGSLVTINNIQTHRKRWI